tara:strand:+ start:972 stop:1538 length:567 start_codon:yes stop_codon:yes gene_type:complete
MRKEIIVGKTIKIEATNFGNSNLSKNYNFLWSQPISPNNSGNDMSFKIENDKMLFTPKCSGNFDISLSIESLNNTTLYEEIFSYYAIDDGSYKEYKPNNVSTNNNNTILSKRYTIQIIADPSIEIAKRYQSDLRDKGFDAYIESLYRDNKQWWRVRVGNFSNKEKGELVKKALLDLGYDDPWLTIIKE